VAEGADLLKYAASALDILAEATANAPVEELRRTATAARAAFLRIVVTTLAAEGEFGRIEPSSWFKPQPRPIRRTSRSRAATASGRSFYVVLRLLSNSAATETVVSSDITIFGHPDAPLGTECAHGSGRSGSEGA